MGDPEEAEIRCWALDSALIANKGKKVRIDKILKDAKKIHNFLTNTRTGEVIKLVRGQKNV